MKHPVTLYVCSLGEIADRLVYYGLQSVLLLYLIHTLLFNDLDAYTLYGILTTLAFGTPVLGGIIADYCLGYSHTLKLGMILTIIASILLATHFNHSLFIGLTLLIMGIGLFKPANSATLSVSYQHLPQKRESGFTLFYLSMNLGAVLGPIFFGYILWNYGWQNTFIASALVSTLVLILYSSLQSFSSSRSLPSTKTSFATKEVQRKDPFKHGMSMTPWKRFLGYGLLMMTLVLIFSFFSIPWLFEISVGVFCCILSIWMVLLIKQFPTETRRRLLFLVILNFFGIIYFACEMQIGSSLMRFVSLHDPLIIGGSTIPTSIFASLEPIFVILSAPLITWGFKYLNKQNKISPIVAKIALGLLLSSLSFWVFSYCTVLHAHKIILVGLIIGSALLGAGELCIGPTLTSAVAKLAPTRVLTTFMGLWFLSIALASYLGSLLAKLSTLPILHSSFQTAFQLIAILGLFSALVLIGLSGYLKQLLGTIK